VPNWLTPSSSSGTASSSGTTVTFTVNANVTGFVPNTYVNSINFNNTTNGQGNTTRVATLTVNAPPVLQVTPATNIAAAGYPGGPFAPSSFQYQLSASAGSVNYSISGVPNWLTPSSTSGTASTGTTVTFTVNTNANTLAPNTYTATITFTNSDTGHHPDPDGDPHRQCTGAASGTHHQCGRRRKSGRTLHTVIISIPTQRERRQHQLFNFRRPKLQTA